MIIARVSDEERNCIHDVVKDIGPNNLGICPIDELYLIAIVD